MVDPEVGQEVPDQKVAPAIGAANEVEDSSSDGKTEVGEEDKVLVLLLVQRARWKKVVDTTTETVLLANTLALDLLGVVIVASHVDDQVSWPTTELLVEQVKGGCDRSVLSELVKLVDCSTDPAGKDFTSLGDENHVTLHVAGGLVVLAVGDLP